MNKNSDAISKVSDVTPSYLNPPVSVIIPVIKHVAISIVISYLKYLNIVVIICAHAGDTG